MCFLHLAPMHNNTEYVHIQLLYRHRHLRHEKRREKSTCKVQYSTKYKPVASWPTLRRSPSHTIISCITCDASTPPTPLKGDFRTSRVRLTEGCMMIILALASRTCAFPYLTVQPVTRGDHRGLFVSYFLISGIFATTGGVTIVM